MPPLVFRALVKGSDEVPGDVIKGESAHTGETASETDETILSWHTCPAERFFSSLVVATVEQYSARIAFAVRASQALEAKLEGAEGGGEYFVRTLGSPGSEGMRRGAEGFEGGRRTTSRCSASGVRVAMRNDPGSAAWNTSDAPTCTPHTHTPTYIHTYAQ